MQIIELIEIWRGGKCIGTITGMTNDEFPEVIAALPDCDIHAGDQLKPYIAEPQA
ncbi:MAG: hypothetical protein HFG26_10530 [Provencibacterium sp.]|nr:hypothetical protein [Provencibacterium sp.]